MGIVSTQQILKMVGCTLRIHLHKATNLKDKDGLGGGKSDPYVLFDLEQDNWVGDKHYDKKKSSVKKDELNPVYEETFTYSDLPGLKNMVLTVKVMDDDMLSDDKIGKCKIKLDDLDLVNRRPYSSSWIVHNKWFSKQDSEIFLTLTWIEG